MEFAKIGLLYPTTDDDLFNFGHRALRLFRAACHDRHVHPIFMLFTQHGYQRAYRFKLTPSELGVHVGDSENTSAVTRVRTFPSSCLPSRHPRGLCKVPSSWESRTRCAAWLRSPSETCCCRTLRRWRVSTSPGGWPATTTMKPGECALCFFFFFKPACDI